nr:MAG TPA: hypothetical protein [Caudoviricetes sp.]DAK95918.1 MAG TPA: hypothetical protein [Caudoviricetes sp.]
MDLTEEQLVAEMPPATNTPDDVVEPITFPCGEVRSE